MGILNVTPDSFSDGGRFDTVEAAVARALRMEEEGADFIDIGAESTRPGHTPVPAEEEWARLEPVFAALSGKISVPLSVDTSKASVAQKALAAGARIVNDVWGLQRDSAMAERIAAATAPCVLMHNQDGREYAGDLIDAIRRFFDETLRLADAAGIPRENIALDPGIGFGKTPEQNIAVLRRLPELVAPGFPLLVGLSRKSFIGKILDIPVGERLEGTLAANVMALQAGARIFRVHDVKENVRALRVAAALS